MPIRINLLAEAQIAEDLRRRDPVKRAIFVGAFLVALALVWSSSLQLAVMISKSELAGVQTRIEARSAQWQDVLASQKKVYEARADLIALQKLTAARFLQGNFMNALQQLYLDGVQLNRATVNQTHSKVAAAQNQTKDGKGGSVPLAMIAEKTVVTLDARDMSTNPGDKVNKFKEMVASQPYFKSILNPTNGVQLVSLSAPQTGTDGKPCVLFTLQCDLPQQIR